MLVQYLLFEDSPSLLEIGSIYLSPKRFLCMSRFHQPVYNGKNDNWMCWLRKLSSQQRFIKVIIGLFADLMDLKHNFSRRCIIMVSATYIKNKVPTL